MAVTTVDICANREHTAQPIVWRLSRLFNVVTNIQRARVTEDSGYLSLSLEGSAQEVDYAKNYLRRLGLFQDGVEAWGDPVNARPEESVDKANTISVRLTTVDPTQAHAPILHRICKDYQIVVHIERAAFDEEEGGWLEITLSGPLAEVQRSIAYLHTTGIHVNPFQRSVTDFSNL